jgi:hypothetical protein
MRIFDTAQTSQTTQDAQQAQDQLLAGETVQDVITLTSQSQAQSALQRQQQATNVLFLESLTGSTSREKNPLAPRTRRKEDVVEPETSTPEPLVSLKPRKRTVADVFGIYEKRKGKLIKVGEEVGKNTAIAKGAKITLSNLGATFTVRKTGEKTVTPFQLQQIEQRERTTRAPLELFRNYKIFKGKPVQLQDTFIQKRATRLTTQNEREELKAARKRPASFLVPSAKRRFLR